MLSEKVQDLEQENQELKARLCSLEELYSSKGDLPKDCRHCLNFIQHYVKAGNSYQPAYTGHCIAGNRTKSRNVDDVCMSFRRMRYGEHYI